MIGKFVIVRTFRAGVHCGVLREVGGGVVILTDARRIWRWRGANSLHELSIHGAAREYTRISEPVVEIMLLDAIEVIPCEPKAEADLRQSRWGT